MSLNLNADQRNCRQRCREKSGQCSNELKLSDNVSRWHSLGVLQSKTCLTASLLHIPLNLRSSEFVFQKTTSVNNVSELIFEYFMAAGLRNEDLSSSGKNTHDSPATIVKAETLLNDNVNRFSRRSAYTKCLESPELTNGSMKKLEKVSALKSSVCGSDQSSELLHGSISKAYLRCVWKDGLPNFVFTMDDNWEEVFVANPYKIESITDEALEYAYLFHARKCRKKGTKISITDSCEFVAKMNVSSSLVLNSSSSKVTETKFVLFVASEDRPMELKISSSASIKGKTLSKKMSSIFKPEYSFNKRKPSFQYDELVKPPFLFELCNADGIDSKKYLEFNFPPNLELASVVVKDSQCNSTKNKPEIGGWGLKFLRKVKLDNSNTTRQNEKIVNVIVPDGFHGGPNTIIGGPSSLIQRWRSGGHCDCGGWDLGCALTVLNQVPSSAKSSPEEHSKEDSKPVYLFTKGGEKGEPILKMVNADEGLHCLYFDRTLSALQCFSVGVAIIHSQTQAFNQNFCR
ncbi:uncharacterized protein LOC120275089 [Dioscorea cayenensis subsp. rotundata]|uniref:Uncharacterized protein LOC120275089 n=1 Tax=Dioscorea cayennensis subsp. rotundata TaxID=55577 RepID=A0AB40CC80_DIOCR|nr:uncharacterized protein LOC120275089 [Dioscorea cayenensis subsp. rotundata]